MLSTLWKIVATLFFHLLQSYKKAVDHNKKSGNDRRTSPYFKELNIIYGYRPNVQPLYTCSSSGLGDTTRVSKEATVMENTIKPSEETEVDSDENILKEDTEKPVKKRVYKSLANESSNKMIQWLDGYEKRKEQFEREKQEQNREQHREKMTILNDILNIMKDKL